MKGYPKGIGWLGWDLGSIFHEVGDPDAKIYRPRGTGAVYETVAAASPPKDMESHNFINTADI